MSTIKNITPPAPALPPGNDPFRFGWREVRVTRPDGTVGFERTPLTLEDLLHPQMGDVMPRSTPHQRDIHYLADVIRRQLADEPSALVLQDVIVNWDRPELRHHSPDLAIFFGVHDPDAERSSFDVAEEGVRPTLIIEVVSPDYRDNDVVTKVEQYHRARVPWYVIVDREDVEGPARLIGYRYRPAGYELLALDELDRLWLEALDIWLGTADNRVVCYDDKGRELGDYVRVTQELEEALERMAAAERQAEEAANRAAEQGRGRMVAEQRANREKERADKENERANREKERADKEKERADREARANAAHENRVRELEEALKQLQGPNAPNPANSDKKE